MDNELIKACEAEAQKWLDSPVYDMETKKNVQSLIKNEDKTELVDAFYRIYGIDIRKAGICSPVYLDVQRIG